MHYSADSYHSRLVVQGTPGNNVGSLGAVWRRLTEWPIMADGRLT
jgi:hypothetical protein